MNTTPTDEVVLKQDVLGRVKTPKARREQLLVSVRNVSVWPEKSARMIFSACARISIHPPKRR